MRQDFNPIIIIGAARTGTNMLRDILSQLPNYTTWDCDEINPIWRHGNINHPNDVFSAEMAHPNAIKYIRKQFSKIAKKNKVQNVIEKSCANSLRIPFINKILPEAKYIFIYRDGRDATASASLRWKAPFELGYTLKKMKYLPLTDIPYYGFKFGVNRIKQFFSKDKKLAFWGLNLENMQTKIANRSLYEISALQWKEATEKANKDLKKIDSKKVYKISYEKFVTNPLEELSKILDFLAVKENIDTTSLTQNVSSKSIGKYKKQLSKEELIKVEKIINQTLIDFDYKSTLQSPLKSLL